MCWASFYPDCALLPISLLDGDFGQAVGTARAEFVVCSLLLICSTLVTLVPASVIVEPHCFAVFPDTFLWENYETNKTDVIQTWHDISICTCYPTPRVTGEFCYR